MPPALAASPPRPPLPHPIWRSHKLREKQRTWLVRVLLQTGDCAKELPDLPHSHGRVLVLALTRHHDRTVRLRQRPIALCTTFCRQLGRLVTSVCGGGGVGSASVTPSTFKSKPPS